jgi:hypothetical protein
MGPCVWRRKGQPNTRVYRPLTSNFRLFCHHYSALSSDMSQYYLYLKQTWRLALSLHQRQLAISGNTQAELILRDNANLTFYSLSLIHVHVRTGIFTTLAAPKVGQGWNPLNHSTLFLSRLYIYTCHFTRHHCCYNFKDSRKIVLCAREVSATVNKTRSLFKLLFLEHKNICCRNETVVKFISRATQGSRLIQSCVASFLPGILNFSSVKYISLFLCYFLML